MNRPIQLIFLMICWLVAPGATSGPFTDSAGPQWMEPALPTLTTENLYKSNRNFGATVGPYLQPPSNQDPLIHNGRPKIAIIIDDIGHHLKLGKRSVNLPGPVACAFLPHRPYVNELAESAHQQGKEILLHLPMEAVSHKHLGPGGITRHTDRESLRHIVANSLHSIPHVQGVNNHMGSRLTQRKQTMHWLMTELKRHTNLFFVDSMTIGNSVAGRTAAEYAIPHTRRDVFLDDDDRPEMVAIQFRRLIQTARKNGVAVAIGHPYPSTLAILERELNRLSDWGVELIPVSQAIRLQQTGANWQLAAKR